MTKLKTEQAFALESDITNEILEIAELYNKVTTSDLQGIAQATAKSIINKVEFAHSKEGQWK